MYRASATRFGLVADSGALERCGGRDALATALVAQLGRDALAPPSAADVVFYVEPGEGEPGSGHVRILSKTVEGAVLGERELPFSEGDCARSLERLAVVLAVLIGSESESAAAPPEGPMPTREKPEPEPFRTAPSPERVKPTPPRPRARVDLAPVVEVALGSGILPGGALGAQGGLFVDVLRLPFRALVRVAYWPPVRTGPAEVDRLGASVLGCARVIRRARLAIELCGGFDAARIAADSTTLTHGAQIGVVLDVPLEGRARFAFAPARWLTVEPVFAIQGAWVLRRDRFAYTDLRGQEQVLLRPSAAAVQASAGVELSFR